MVYLNYASFSFHFFSLFSYFTLSIHDIDLIDSLRMAEKLFGTKSELLVLGVEPKDYVTWNIGLSDDVRAVFPEFLALARKEIGEWLKRYGNEETRA